MAQDVVGRRLLLLEQHLHQVVVEVGERLEHLGARRLLALAIFLGQVDPVRRRAVVVAVGLLGHQVDVADQLVAAPDRILVRDHRPVGQIAQALQQIAIAHLRAVHLVDEDEMRDLVLIEELEERRDRDHALDHRLDHDHRGIDAEQGGARLLGELDRSRTVEDGEPGAVVLGGRGIDLDAHLALARLGRGVADGVALARLALAVDAAGHEQQALEKRGLAGPVGTDQCDITDRGSCGHGILPDRTDMAVSRWRRPCRRARDDLCCRHVGSGGRPKATRKSPNCHDAPPRWPLRPRGAASVLGARSRLSSPRA